MGIIIIGYWIGMERAGKGCIGGGGGKQITALY